MDEYKFELFENLNHLHELYDMKFIKLEEEEEEEEEEEPQENTNTTGNHQPVIWHNVDLTEMVCPHVEELMALKPLNEALKMIFNPTNDTGIMDPSMAAAQHDREEDVLRTAFTAMDELTPMEFPFPDMESNKMKVI